MRRASVLTGPVLLLLFLLAPREAAACSCISSGPACQAFWKTDAVFDATVDAIEAANKPEQTFGNRIFLATEKRVRMTVRRALKGVTATGPLDVYTDDNGASCGYDFKPGHRYLVFAWKRPSDGRWVASLCSATQPYEGTGEAAAFVASLTEPAKGGRVFGTVRAFEQSFDYQQRSQERRLSANVRLVGAGREHSTTSTNGSFEFVGLEPGRYLLALEPPEGYAATYTSVNVNVDIPDGRACHEQTFHLTPAGRVTGLVLTADGRPAVNVQIELTTPEAQIRSTSRLLTLDARTANDGTFEIAGVPPGRYLLGVNLKGLPPRYSPYGRTLYPSDGSGDGIVQVGKTGSYDVGTWRLPPPRDR